MLAGAGVGGGSLNYANTLYEPLPAFYSDSQWGHITDWRAELAPFYDQAKRMLGVTTYAGTTPSDEAMRAVAAEMGVGDTFHPTPVGVFFGGPGTPPGSEVEDPYFGGVGPRRRTCTECGECMTGCRHNAKNTLMKNYLHLAERAGARVLPMTTATSVDPLPGGGFGVEIQLTGSRRTPRTVRRLTAEQVVVAAGTYGTQKLLHRMRDTGHLPGLSDRLGVLTRTNSEAILGAKARGRDVDYSRGVAITSSFHPDAATHIEAVRYGKGSNSMGLLQTLLTDGGGRVPRWLKVLAEIGRHPAKALGTMNVRHWSEKSIIALVMQSLDNSLTVSGRQTAFGYRLTSRQGHGEPNPTWIPAGNRAVRLLAERIGGDAGGTWSEAFDKPLTAHFLGGCVIGDSAETGVIDPYHRAYGQPGLHVVDGSAISANLGVNPSLTITAQAERAMAFWPNRGEPDPRPALGSAYRQIRYVAPTSPLVPTAAPGALRLPLVEIR